MKTLNIRIEDHEHSWIDFPTRFVAEIRVDILEHMLKFVEVQEQLGMKWLFYDLLEAPSVPEYDKLNDAYDHFNHFTKEMNIKLIGDNSFRIIFPNRYGPEVLESEEFVISDLLTDQELEDIEKRLPILGNYWTAKDAYNNGFEGEVSHASEIVSAAIDEGPVHERINGFIVDFINQED